MKGDETTAIVISVVYRGCAIPVAWRIRRANQRESWMDPIVELLQDLAPAVPREMTVIVLCDRGLASPKLWKQIRAQSLPSATTGGRSRAEKRGMEMGQDQENRPGAHLPTLAGAVKVATLLALAYGTRVEDAQDRRIAPSNLRAPPKHLASTHHSSWSRPGRTVSVIRHGIDWLRRLLLRGRLWNRVWLLPEPGPEPKLNLEVTHHAPA